MAKMMPPYIDPDAPSSEKRVFDRLRDDPQAQDWTVLHSLGLARRRTGPYGEIDFVVLIPGKGIVCLEIKGGRVSCQDGMWRTTDRHGIVHELRKSPIMQARESMFALIDAIEKHFGRDSAEHRCPMTHAVVFPDVRELPRTPEFEPCQAICHDDLQSIAVTMDRLVRTRLRRHGPAVRLEPPQAKAIRKFLRPTFDLVPAKSVALARSEERLLSLTEEQYDRLDELEDNPRCLFKGAAGTGKTLLAIEYARRQSQAGARVLIICYNRLLGSWLTDQFQDTDVVAGAWEATIERIILDSSVGDDYRTAKQTCEGAGADDDAKRVFHREDFPLYARLALDELDEPPFDLLVVDEAQDLLDRAFVPVLDRVIEGGLADGRWSMFGDFTRQMLYGRDRDSGKLSPEDLERDFGVQFSTARLVKNCRNTKSIAEATAAISGFDTPPCRAAPGPELSVLYEYWKQPGDWQRKVADTIENLVKDDFRPEDIMVLAPGRREREDLLQAGQIAGQPVINCAATVGKESRGIKVATIHAFKGMESPVVIIAGLDRDLKDMTQSLLYVGMSRARSLLVLVVHKKAREAIQRRIRAVTQKT